jgi:protein O-mannosyl-transferase
MADHESPQEEFSFKNYFVPFTSSKAITWIILIGLILYFNSLFNGFVGDDLGQIVQNPAIQSLTNIPNFFMGGTFYAGNAANLTGTYYRPIVSTIYAFLYAFFGPNPFIYHFFQIVIHIANAVLVFLILRVFFKRNISFFAALLFLVHPIQAEAVDYIADLQEVLFFFFGSLAFLLELTLPSSIKKNIWIVILLVLSVLSKETGVLYVLMILVYKYIFSKRNEFNKSVLLYACLGVVYLFFRFLFTHGIYFVAPYTPIAQSNILTRLLTVPLILSYYLQTIIFPVHLAINQTWLVTTRPLHDFYISLAEIIICVCLLVWFGRKIGKKYFKIYLFFVIWLCLGLLFHSQIFAVLDFTVSDRWFYFSFVGLLGIMSLVIQQYFKKVIRYKKIIIFFAGVILIILSVRTFVRNANFYDQYTLLSHDVHYSNDSNIQSALALELMKRNDYSQAYIYLQDAVKLDPNGYLDWTDLGIYYQQTGQINKAEGAFRTSLKNASYYQTYEDLAVLMLLHEKPRTAESYLKSSLQKLPTEGYLWFIYTLEENKIGNKKEALEAAKKTLYYFPNSDTYLLYNLLSKNVPVTFKAVQSSAQNIIYICSRYGCS